MFKVYAPQLVFVIPVFAPTVMETLATLLGLPFVPRASHVKLIHSGQTTNIAIKNVSPLIPLMIVSNGKPAAPMAYVLEMNAPLQIVPPPMPIQCQRMLFATLPLVLAFVQLAQEIMILPLPLLHFVPKMPQSVLMVLQQLRVLALLPHVVLTE
jgi:hypothetical protein